MTDPPAVPQRSFSSDYPQTGISQPYGSRIAFDIDGAPLSPTATIAGRTTVGGMDEGVRGASLRNTAEALGARIGSGTSSTLGKDLGRYVTGRGPDGEVSRQILMRAGQPEAQYGHVFGHEVGHVVDRFVGHVPESRGISPGNAPFNNGEKRVVGWDTRITAMQAVKATNEPKAGNYEQTVFPIGSIPCCNGLQSGH